MQLLPLKKERIRQNKEIPSVIGTDDTGHGTCVASKGASPTFGFNKSANIVVMKLHPIGGHLHVSHVIAAWGVVTTDIDSKDMQRTRLRIDL